MAWPKTFLQWFRSLLGFYSLFIIGIDLLGAQPIELFVLRIVHVPLCVVSIGNVLEPPRGAYLSLWFGILSFVTQAHEGPLETIWSVYRVLAVVHFLLLVPGGMIACCGKRCTCSVCVVLAAVVLEQLAGLIAFIIPEDVQPRLVPGPSLVETPHLRDRYCKVSGGVNIPKDLRYVCDGIVPLSWEEAQEKAREALKKMTMAERHSLMKGNGWQPVPFLPIPAMCKRGYYMGNTPPVPSIGLPALKLHDAGNCFRNNPWPLGQPGSTVSWPSSLALGATWDLKLIGRVAAAIGREYRGKGANVLLGPAVQVHRTPRGGRNFEYMGGEDPYLSSRYSEAYVRAVQGEGVIACLKHFAFNEQETLRSDQTSEVDERTAWEVYYPPFEAGIAAGAGAVMCSYNKVNGTYSCHNEALLARDLKKKMGFKGWVMSDWWALHAAPQVAVPRGFDQEMPGLGGETFFHAEELEKMEREKAANYQGVSGLDRESMYKDAAFRILSAAYKMRLFERDTCTPGSDCVAALESDQRSRANLELAHVAATESVVLLRNNGVLPITKESKIRTLAVVGLAADAPSLSLTEAGMQGDYYSGGGSGHCTSPKESHRTPLEWINKRAGQLGIHVISAPDNLRDQAREVARKADLTIFIGATTSQESQDREFLELDFDGPRLIKSLSDVSPLVVLMQVPGMVMMDWIDDVQAAALIFLAGERTGSAWASVLFGDANPSGKLPIQIPTVWHGPEISITDTVSYSEGLFFSYRNKSALDSALFPFGYGLSYTTFSYEAPGQILDGCQAFVCVRARVVNNGTVAGAEVAQAYVEFPPEAEEPKIVLRGFQKTGVLPPGEGEVVEFGITRRDLSIYKHGDWQLVRGTIAVHIGASSRDLRHSLTLQLPQ